MCFFNNAGPSVPGQHYMIDPLARGDVLSGMRTVARRIADSALAHLGDTTRSTS